MAYTAALLERGAQTWNSPDVLHWSAWQGRQADTLRGPRHSATRRLSSVEEWYLWREALGEAEDALGLLQPDGLLDDLRRADELIDATPLGSAAVAGIEGALLSRLRKRLASIACKASPTWRVGNAITAGILGKRAFELNGIETDVRAPTCCFFSCFDASLGFVGWQGAKQRGAQDHGRRLDRGCLSCRS